MSIETWRSFIASSSALWVLGVERLISSASTMWWKTGPFLNSNAPDLPLKMDTPRMSDGRRSEVNWMRWKVRSRLLESASARVVLPTPGMSSIRRCPSARMQRIACRTMSFFPRKIFVTLDSMRAGKDDSRVESLLISPNIEEMTLFVNRAFSGFT